MANFISSMSDVLGTFSKHPSLDDGVDRLNRIYTPVVLICTASILGVVQFVGDPIECTMDNRHAPTEYVKDYIKSWCWTHGTYDNIDGKNPTHINYYQWVPVVIALQAFFFQLPFVFWSSMATAGGMNLLETLAGAEKLCEVMMSTRESTREEVCEEAVHVMDGFFKQRLVLRSVSLKKRTYLNLVSAFFFAKFLYILNIILQLYAIDSFFKGRKVEQDYVAELGEDQHENVIQYSSRAVFGLLAHGEWENSWRFPMLAMCRYYSEGRLAFNCKNKEVDYRGRKVCPPDGEVLCTLPLNLYNDKVFAVMTMLMLLLMVASTVYFLIWVWRLYVPQSRNYLVLKILYEQNHEDKNAVYRFLGLYLRADGILVLKLIRHNLGINTATEIIEALFKKFEAQEERLKIPSLEVERNRVQPDRYAPGLSENVYSSTPKEPTLDGFSLAHSGEETKLTLPSHNGPQRTTTPSHHEHFARPTTPTPPSHKGHFARQEDDNHSLINESDLQELRERITTPV